MSLSAVIFDLDGLLIDTENASKLAWMQTAAAFGFELPEALYAQIAGTTVTSAKKLIASTFDKLDIEAYMKGSSTKYYELLDQSGIHAMTGAREMLNFLKRSSIEVAVARSAARYKLEQADLSDEFSIVVSGEDVVRGKPEPDLFVLTAQLLEIPTIECMVIEDAEPGILGAHRAGMQSIMVPSTTQPSHFVKNIAYSIEPTLKEVIPILHKLINRSID